MDTHRILRFQIGWENTSTQHFTAIFIFIDRQAIRGRQRCRTFIRKTEVHNDRIAYRSDSGYILDKIRIRSRIKHDPILGQFGGLLQERIKRFSYIGTCTKRCCYVKQILWHTHILINIDHIIGPLVPHFTCRSPCIWGFTFKDRNTTARAI